MAFSKARRLANLMSTSSDSVPAAKVTPADGSISTAKLANNAVTSAKIGVDVIVAEDVAANAITVSELANNAVTTVKIADANVTTAKIADGAITAAKFAAGAGAVTIASSNPAVGSEGSLLYNTTTDKLYASNGSAWNPVSNQAPVTTGGTVTISTLASGGTFNYNLGLNFADATDTDAQLTYTLHSGSLPGGCTLPSSGNSAFTGTASDPSTDTTFNFSIKGTDSAGAFGIQAYQQIITNSPPTASGGTVTITGITQGATFNYNLGLNFTDATNTDAQLTYTLQSGTLPGGCTLPSSGNSAFTGTSNNGGTFNFVIRATDASSRFVDQTYTQTVTVPFSATGGTITTVGSYKVHTFTSSGTFTPSTSASNIDIMWVAGGAGGGGGRHGGGGGAGGMRTLTGQTVAATGYTVTIGAGGPGGQTGGPGQPLQYTGQAGGNTSVNFPTTLTNIGGGGGGSYSSSTKNGGSGGSGGGLGHAGVVGSGTSGQGNAGGGHGQNPYYGGGGGGGKGEVGPNGTGNGGGRGGNGVQNNYRTGSNIYYAGGGGGSAWSNGPPGAGSSGGGGAGNNQNNTATSGLANTGGGGGGSAGPSNSSTGGAGGSGIMVIRYPA